MAKEKVDKTIKEIRALIESKKAVVGTQETIKNLKLGKVAKVYLTANCPDKLKEDVNYYSKLSKAEVVQLNYPNDELGVVCKKPFSISMLSVLK